MSASGINIIKANHIHMMIVLSISVCQVKYFGLGQGPAYKIAFPAAATNMDRANPVNRDIKRFHGKLLRK